MSLPYNIPHHIWQQIRSITSKELLHALMKDSNWTLERVKGSAHYFHNPKRPPTCQDIAIHVHPTKGGYGSTMLKGLLSVIRWTEDEYRKLKLIR